MFEVCVICRLVRPSQVHLQMGHCAICRWVSHSQAHLQTGQGTLILNFRVIRRWVSHLQVGDPSADPPMAQTHLQMGEIGRWRVTYKYTSKSHIFHICVNSCNMEIFFSFFLFPIFHIYFAYYTVPYNTYLKHLTYRLTI